MRVTDDTPVMLRPSVLAFRIEDTLQFVLTGSGIVKVFSADDLAFRMVDELSSGIQLPDLESRVRAVRGYSAEHFTEILEVLSHEHLIQRVNEHVALPRSTRLRP